MIIAKRPRRYEAQIGTCGLAEYCTEVCAAATVFDNVAVTGIQDACPAPAADTTAKQTSGAGAAAPVLAAFAALFAMH